MNLWLNIDDQLIIVAPLSNKLEIDNIDLTYTNPNIKFIQIPEIEFTSFLKSIKSIFKIPQILLGILKGIKLSDHIHLRCPGNIGLLGCLVQIFFPSKKKTAKYAGNWIQKVPNR